MDVGGGGGGGGASCVWRCGVVVVAVELAGGWCCGGVLVALELAGGLGERVC